MGARIAWLRLYVALFLWVPGILLTLAQDGNEPGPRKITVAELLQSAVSHRWTDETRAEQFTYRETWRNRNFSTSGALLVDQSARFEAIALHGQLYLRMTARDGKPLSGAEEEQESQSYDAAIAGSKGLAMPQRVAALVTKDINLGLQLDLLPDFYRCELIGIEPIDGRNSVHLDCTPRRDRKPHGKAPAQGMNFRVQVWVDEQDHTFARVDAQLLKNQDGFLPGSRISLVWSPVEEVWLPTKMSVRGETKARHGPVQVETEYSFSAYRRFRTDVRILNTTPIDNQPQK